MPSSTTPAQLRTLRAYARTLEREIPAELDHTAASILIRPWGRLAKRKRAGTTVRAPMVTVGRLSEAPRYRIFPRVGHV